MYGRVLLPHRPVGVGEFLDPVNHSAQRENVALAGLRVTLFLCSHHLVSARCVPGTNQLPAGRRCAESFPA